EKQLNWDDLRLFLAVARAGGLSGAIEPTNKSAATLGRRMIALEEMTGQVLFERLPKGYVLTEQGGAMFDMAAMLEEQISPFDQSSQTTVTTQIRISAGQWMTHMLCEKIKSISKGDEDTRIRFISADETLSISRREATIGIRNQRPKQEHLVCRKTGRVRFAGYASKKSVKDWIRVVADTPSARWVANEARGESPLEVTSSRSALDLALRGAGRIVLPTFVGDGQSRLVRVTQTITELSHDQWLVTHQGARAQPQISTTIDRLYNVIKDILSVA
ncbi:MAG: LysR family transcriptional regulator, partial [Gammaproteobacteria bacterium]|nr:LysR family transcriptional regulator [Gammaproteobacteria bacterium]